MPCPLWGNKITTAPRGAGSVNANLLAIQTVLTVPVAVTVICARLGVQPVPLARLHVLGLGLGAEVERGGGGGVEGVRSGGQLVQHRELVQGLVMLCAARVSAVPL